MYQLLNRVGSADNSPFQYARAEYLRSRIAENFGKLVEARQHATGRVDSSHLLFKIFTNLNVPFSGDLGSYMTHVESACKRLCGILGITSSFSHGLIHQDGHFYSDLPEIIIYARNARYTVMDLWHNWRTIAAIQVVNHPVTSLNVFELGVKNAVEIPSSEIAVITIDIPLLAAQWKMWQAATGDGTFEAFLTAVPLANMVKSHLNVAFFNRLMEKLGIRPGCAVSDNVTFAQTPVLSHADQLIQEVIDKVGNKTMTGNQIMASIPMFFGPGYLDTVELPPMSPTFQVEWALIYQKIDALSVMLEFGKRAGYDRMVKEIAVIKRTMIQMEQEKTFTSGTTAMGSHLMVEKLNKYVVSRLPA